MSVEPVKLGRAGAASLVHRDRGDVGLHRIGKVMLQGDVTSPESFRMI